MRLQWILFFIGLIIWVNYMTKSENPQYIPPPTPPGISVAANVFKQGIELLGLNFRISSANAAEKSVTIPKNSIVPQEGTLFTEQFIVRNGIQTSYDVEKFDKKATEDLLTCTRTGNRMGDQNFIYKLQARIGCLRSKGYDDNDIIYIGGKHGEAQ